MKLALPLAILCTLICPFTINAQNSNNNNTYYNTTNQQTGDIQYFDQNGNPYYLDKQGVPYYIDKQGYPFYLNDSGQPYYIDERGAIYYLDSEGYPYYLDQNGNSFYYDKNNKPFYYDQNGDIVYYNSNQQNNKSYSDYNNQKTTTRTDADILNKYRIAIGGGYAYKLGSSAGEDITRSGFNLDADAQLFLTDLYGLGVTFNYASFKPMSHNKQKLTYVAPSFAVRHTLDKILFIGNIGAGPIFYKDTYRNKDFTKTIVGFSTAIGGEYKLNDNLGLGIKLSGVFGSFKDDDYNNNNRINASSLNLTGFISFRAK